MVPCECCHGNGFVMWDHGAEDCPECDGFGEVEAEPEEPDGDYEYERRRDAIMDRG
jgi:DnaJ-class molecular chaperone